MQVKDWLFLKKIEGSGITITNNEIINIGKVIRFLENRVILLKGTTGKKIMDHARQHWNLKRRNQRYHRNS